MELTSLSPEFILQLLLSYVFCSFFFSSSYLFICLFLLFGCEMENLLSRLKFHPQMEIIIYLRVKIKQE